MYNIDMSKKLAGKKYSGSHSTVIDAAYCLVREVEKMDEVGKISLGIIKSCSPGRGGQRIKIKDTLSGMELMVRGGLYVQTIYLYLSTLGQENKNEVAEKITAIFESNGNARREDRNE